MLPYSDVFEASLRKLREDGLPVLSQILLVMVGDAPSARRIGEEVPERHGLSVQPIDAPTVPPGGERPRITPTPLHTKDHRRIPVGTLIEIRSRPGWGEVSRAA